MDLTGAASSNTPAQPQRSQRSPWEVQRSVLFALLLREFKTRFGGRWLGAVWTIGEPLVHLSAMVLILGWRHNRSGMDYSMFLITGLIPFFMFRNLGTRLMGAIEANLGLFAYRQVKPFDTLISRAVLETSVYSVVYVVLLALFASLEFEVVPNRPLELIALSAIFLIAGFGLGTALTVLVDVAPQSRVFVRLAFWPLYFLSGVILPVHTLPQTVQEWFLWNPILHALELMRSYWFSGYVPVAGVSVAYVAGFALAILSLGMVLYRVRRHRLKAVS